MSDAMIWTFGILLFVVLMRLINALFAKHEMRGMRRYAGQTSGVTRKDLTALTSGLDEIKTRLDSIEQILQTVE